MIRLTTRKEMSRINEMARIIQKNGKISKVQLVLGSGISISYFEKLRPFLLEIYKEQLEYDSNLKLFVSTKSIKVAE